MPINVRLRASIITLIEGEDVTIVCQCNTKNLTWKKVGEPTVFSNAYSINKLSIHRVQRRHAGKYTCISSLGERRTVTLNVLCKFPFPH